MPAVLVHGVPDTHHVWDELIPRLDRDDIVTVDLPGFQGARPEHWGATKEEYVDWVIAEIEAIGEPVDLVGHDWGSLLTIRIAALRPDLLHSWAAGNGPVDETYVWHDVAQMWQTPDIGEQVMEAITPAALRDSLVDGGLEPHQADVAARHVDEDMKSCILDLYRSAVDVGNEWGPSVDGITARGLVIWATNDLAVPLRYGERLAERTGSKLVTVDSGHWWPLEAAQPVADALNEFWG